MKNGKAKILSLTFLMAIAGSAAAQGTSSGGNNLFLIALIAVVALLVLGIMVQVADNLLAVEATRRGVNTKGRNFSIFPRWKEIISPKVPKYVAEDASMTFLRKGHDILLEGEAEETINTSVSAKTFAVQPPNFHGMSPIPKVLVEEGATVKAGDPVFFDKKHPDIIHVAPVSGEVIAVNRGAKRAIANVVILADKEIQYRKLDAFDLENSSRDQLVEYLLANGGWPLMRQRPYNILPEADVIPANIFVSTFDTAPLAPNSNLVAEGKKEAFQKGLDVLNKLTDGSVHLGLDGRGKKVPSTVFSEAQGVEKHYFHGKHPAGNVGIHIHHIAPVSGNKKVWTLGVQEVITLGTMFAEQKYDATRVVAVTGAQVTRPQYVKTYAGANIGDLIKDNLKEDNVRIISGDVLSGAKKTAEQFLDFYDDQITVIKEGDYYEMFGWLLALKSRPSVSGTYLTAFMKNLKFEGDTNTHGEKRAFVVTGQYERMLPMDIYVQHLMKSIIINDFERMEGLGIYELVEEDVALAEFACTSKQPLQQLLREGLDTMREQG
jgi:Na+-transporting NADH:ubiquinone oxidoreductase subunit A